MFKLHCDDIPAGVPSRFVGILGEGLLAYITNTERFSWGHVLLTAQLCSSLKGQVSVS